MTDHQTETYKSMIAISTEAIKYCALVNGGAAVAILAYLGNVYAKAPSTAPVPDLSGAMAWFLAGLLFAGSLIGAAYLTQLMLYNESFNDPIPRKTASHKYSLWIAMACFAMSLLCFGVGSSKAVAAWAIPITAATIVNPVEPTPALDGPQAMPEKPKTVTPAVDLKEDSKP